jgi:predicted membrane-bound spermidine synthase
MYGSLYLATGMIITAFMAGMSIGSLVPWRFVRGKPAVAFVWVQAVVGLFAFLLPVILVFLKGGNWGDIVVYPVFLVLTAGIGALIGLEFSLASRMLDDVPASVAGRLYGTDLLGSAAGALIVSAFLLPLLGITWVCVIVGCLSLGGAGLIMATRMAPAHVHLAPTEP